MNKTQFDNKRYQEQTIKYIISLIEDLRYFHEIEDNALFVSLVLDAQKTLNKLRMELNETN